MDRSTLLSGIRPPGEDDAVATKVRRLLLERLAALHLIDTAGTEDSFSGPTSEYLQ